VNKSRWNYIKRLQPAPPRFVHVSKQLSEVVDSEGRHAYFYVPRGGGKTFDIGRNAKKRALRESRKGGVF
jgi:hypothetical protein